MSNENDEIQLYLKSLDNHPRVKDGLDKSIEFAIFMKKLTKEKYPNLEFGVGLMKNIEDPNSKISKETFLDLEIKRKLYPIITQYEKLLVIDIRRKNIKPTDEYFKTKMSNVIYNKIYDNIKIIIERFSALYGDSIDGEIPEERIPIISKKSTDEKIEQIKDRVKEIIRNNIEI